MSKRCRVILIILVAVLLVGSLAYYGIMKYAFRNFAGTGNYPMVLKEYAFEAKKEYVEYTTINIVYRVPRHSWFADTNTFPRQNGWNKVHFLIGSDTLDFVYKFMGTDSNWNSESTSRIGLFGMDRKGREINSISFDKDLVTQKQLDSAVLLFETLLIDPVKKKMAERIEDTVSTIAEFKEIVEAALNKIDDTARILTKAELIRMIKINNSIFSYGLTTQPYSVLFDRSGRYLEKAVDTLGCEVSMGLGYYCPEYQLAIGGAMKYPGGSYIVIREIKRE
jgi:hypothetical protein